MIKPYFISLIYGGRSKQYARIMKKLILEATEYYVVLPVLMDDDTIRGGLLFDNIFESIKACDYAYIFLSEDYKVSDAEFGIEKTISKQNPILECGFLIGVLNDLSKIEIMISFSYKMIENHSYLFPSDLIGMNVQEIDERDPHNDLKNKLNRTLKSNKDVCKLKVGARDLLINCIEYKVDYATLFSESEIVRLANYTLYYQYQHTLESWIKEAEDFTAEYADANQSVIMFNMQVVYLFERLVLLSVFPQLKDNSNRFVISMNPNYSQPYQKAICDLFGIIREYILHMQGKTINFFIEIEREISRLYLELKQYKINPIIEIVTENYIGLCNWNISRQLYVEISNLKNTANARFDENNNVCIQKSTAMFNKCLRIAEGCFKRVINLDKMLGDSLEIYKSFAYYNLGRVKYYLYGLDSCKDDLNQCIELRGMLAQKNEYLPGFLLNYFLCEKINAQITLEKICIENNENTTQRKNKLNELAKELEKLDNESNNKVNLFKSLKTNIEQYLKN